MISEGTSDVRKNGVQRNTLKKNSTMMISNLLGPI